MASTLTTTRLMVLRAHASLNASFGVRRESRFSTNHFQGVRWDAPERTDAGLVKSDNRMALDAGCLN